MPCAGIWYGVLAPRGSSSARASNLLHAGSDRFVTLLCELLTQLAQTPSMILEYGLRLYVRNKARLVFSLTVYTSTLHLQNGCRGSDEAI